MKRKDNDIPGEMYLDHATAYDETTTANLFATHFKTVYKKPISDHKTDFNTLFINESRIRGEGQEGDLNEYEITCEEVKNVINLLKSSYSCGPDKIPAILIKKCAPAIVYPLSKIYSRSLEEGVFPGKWKLSCVRPIYKQGDKSSIENYRLVCPLSPLASIFENIVYRRLMDMLKHNITPH